jgi:hypothetical protein
MRKGSFSQRGSSGRSFGQYQNGEPVTVPFIAVEARPGTRITGLRETESWRRRNIVVKFVRGGEFEGGGAHKSGTQFVGADSGEGSSRGKSGMGESEKIGLGFISF